MGGLRHGNTVCMTYPKQILHWIDGKEETSRNGGWFSKYNPATGEESAVVSRGTKEDIDLAVLGAKQSALGWKDLSPVIRGEVLRNVALLMQARKEDIARIVSLETGKSFKDAFAETGVAIEMGFFVAGEGRRFYGKTVASAMEHRRAMTIRVPVGVCGLIVASNTPIANVAWKAFPALLCGNTAIMKPSEHTPYIALLFAKLLAEAGVPPGVFQIVQGLGEEAGNAVVSHEDVLLISFTGSVPVGRSIQVITGKRLAKTCLELGGKNPFIVCDDADLDVAARDAALSAFSNAGQRCASGSRIIVFSSVYEEFKKKLLAITLKLSVGTKDSDDVGPVITEAALNRILSSVERSVNGGEARILCGGKRLLGKKRDGGYFLAPTLLERVHPDSEISQEELFGPVSCLYKVKNFSEAIALANDTKFGLTAAIHTNSIHRIEAAQELLECGVVSINGPTYGSEPHLPFGGVKNSGTGWREAGTEALDVYSEWKTIYTRYNPKLL